MATATLVFQHFNYKRELRRIKAKKFAEENVEQLKKGVAIATTVTALGVVATSNQKNSLFELDTFKTAIAVDANVPQIGESTLLASNSNLQELTSNKDFVINQITRSETTGTETVNADTEVEALEVTGTETVNADTEVEALEVTGTETVNADTEVEALEVTGTETVNADTEYEALEVTGTEMVKADTNIINSTENETDIVTMSAGAQVEENVMAEEELAMTARAEIVDEQVLQPEVQMSEVQSTEIRVAEVKETVIEEEQMSEVQSADESVTANIPQIIEGSNSYYGITINFFKVNANFLWINAVKTGVYKPTEEEIEIVAKLIYCEARGEGLEGMILVGNSAVSRAVNKNTDIITVVTQEGQYASITGVTDDMITDEIREAARMSFEVDLAQGALRAIAEEKGFSSSYYEGGGQYFFNPEGCKEKAIRDRQYTYGILYNNHIVYADANTLK